MLSAIPSLTAAGSLISQSVDSIGSTFQNLFNAQSSAAEGEQPSNEELSHRYEQNLQRFHQLVRRQLQDNGIGLQQPVQLRLSGLGRVIADAFHPQREAIEQLFNKNPSLTQQFEELARQRRELEGTNGNGRELRISVGQDQIGGELV
jgi:hypothetical protein